MNRNDDQNPDPVGACAMVVAAAKIFDGVRHVPAEKSVRLSALTKTKIFLKKEFLQVSGSYAERGMLNLLMQLTPTQRARGVVTASDGSNGLGLAYQGHRLSSPVTVVVSQSASLTTVLELREFGARVVTHGIDLEESSQKAREISESEELALISPDDPRIIAGNGSIGFEIYQEHPDCDAVIIPVGSGSLISGVSVAMKSKNQSILVVGVETLACPSFLMAREARQPVDVEAKPSLARGLSVRTVGRVAFVTGNPSIDTLVQVTEDQIGVAMVKLLEKEKILAEANAAVSLAAVIGGHLPDLVGKKIVILITGANVGTSKIGRFLDRGLSSDQRLYPMTVTVSESTGGISKLLSTLKTMGVHVDLNPSREWTNGDVFSEKINLVVETLGSDHAYTLFTQLAKQYGENFQTPSGYVVNNTFRKKREHDVLDDDVKDSDDESDEPHTEES